MAQRQSTALFLEDYQVSPLTGFLPEKPALHRLPEPLRTWETICADLYNLSETGQLTSTVKNLSRLSTDHLRSEDEWRRAYVVLGFIAHAYLRGPKAVAKTLPASIAVPFLKVAHHLSIPPVATYTAENLWNFTLSDPNSPENPDNFVALATFTGTKDEEWFFALPAAIEARGGPIIPLTIEVFQSVIARDSRKATGLLQEIAVHIKALSTLLPRMYEKCNPDVFYHTIRPFLAGLVSSELPDGIFFEDGEGGGSFQKWKGPTAAQSPLFHFLDLAFGVSHERSIGTVKGPSEKDFLEVDLSMYAYVVLTASQEMRGYMVEPHRRFLDWVGTAANIRQFVHSHLDDPSLLSAYNECLAELASYRNKHIQIVSRYIVIPSKAGSRSEIVVDTVPGTAGRMVNSPPPEASIGARKAVALGTGGTAPIEFLKNIRNDTKASVI